MKKASIVLPIFGSIFLLMGEEMKNTYIEWIGFLLLGIAFFALSKLILKKTL